MPANGRGWPPRAHSGLDQGRPFRARAELLINQVEGHLIATGGNFCQRLLAVLTRGRSHRVHGARSFDDVPSFTSELHYQINVT